MNKFLVFMGAVVGIILLLTVGAIVNGWVFSILWGWFIVPIFALPVLSIPQAIGVGMVASWITYQYQKSENTDWSDAIATSIIRPLGALGIGYIVTLFL